MKTLIFLILVVITGTSASQCAKDSDEQCSEVPQNMADGSCQGSCGQNDGTSGCQCNIPCENFNDCCSDYVSVCYSCQNRCGEGYLDSKPCQCNFECAKYGNCCDDYDLVCDGSSSGATDADVIALSEELYQLSEPFLVGDLITYDSYPPGPLFTYVDPAVFNVPTISTFMPLRDNYDPFSSIYEFDDAQELAEKAAFLDAVMATDVMVKTEQFMNEFKMITKPLRDVIDEIFFTRYPRDGNTLGSSGFEHSFIGEIDDGQVKGFHNWISFYEDEQNGDLTYNYCIDDEVIGSDLSLFEMGFDWYDYNKPVSSMWIGSTPDLELALYTVCFYHAPNSLCEVSMNGIKYRIQTYIQNYNGGKYVGSAYPDIL